MERRASDISIPVDDDSSSTGLDLVPDRAADPPSQSLRARLSIVPEPIVPPILGQGRSASVLAVAASVLVNGGFALLFVLLASWRTLPTRPEQAIPIEIVASMPDVPKPKPPDARPSSPASGQSGPSPSKPEAAAPPPLLAPPPEPPPAAPQPLAAKPITPLPSPLTPDKSLPSSAPPPETPSVLASRQGGFAVAPPAPAPPVAPANTPAPPGNAPAVNMNDVLPMNLSLLPSTFLSVLSGNGAQIDGDYKGLVFARITRSHKAVEDAQNRHLKGHVIVSFSVDAQGHATDLAVVSSSGTPALDALGLDMVKEAEPFPLPPPGAKRTFTPSFSFGED